VVGHTTHGNGITALFVTCSEGDLQLARPGNCVLEKELVKVTEAKEQERAGILLLQLEILAQHGR
jgi:hypothetical protein